MDQKLELDQGHRGVFKRRWKKMKADVFLLGAVESTVIGDFEAFITAFVLILLPLKPTHCLENFNGSW